MKKNGLPDTMQTATVYLLRKLYEKHSPKQLGVNMVRNRPNIEILTIAQDLFQKYGNVNRVEYKKMGKKRKKGGMVIAIIFFIASIAVIIGYLAGVLWQDKAIKELKGSALLELKATNDDIIGWIKIPDTKVDYPVMRGEEYLHMNFEKKYSYAGLPFVKDEWDENVTNTLIYGHNMYTGAMFHDLQKYLDQDFYKAHSKMIFYAICENGSDYTVEKRTYKIFSAVETHIARWPYQDYANKHSADDIPKYIAECKERQLYDTKIDPDSDNLLTLSTCSHHNYGKKGRIVIVGYLTDKK